MDEMERDFYTKAEINEMFNVETTEDTGRDFYTKSEIVAKVGTPETLVLPPDMLDFYTKIEIDSIPIDPLANWADFIAEYETRFVTIKQTVDNIINGTGTTSEKSNAVIDYAKQFQHLRDLKETYARIEESGIFPSEITFGIGGAAFIYKSNVDDKIHILNLSQRNSSGDINRETIQIGTFLESDQFTISAAASYDYASPTATPKRVSFSFYSETSGVNIANGIVCSSDLTYYHRVKFTATGNVFNGGLYDQVFPNSSKMNFIWGYPGNFTNPININPTSSGVTVPISATHISQIVLIGHIINSASPWDYYNNYLLPELTATTNAVFPNGYNP